MFDSSRLPDIKLLEEELKTASPTRRRKIEDIIRSFSRESREIRSMRSALIKAHRSGNIDEIKDDHDFMEGKKKYVK